MSTSPSMPTSTSATAVRPDPAGRPARVLSIAGTDPTGGAGTAADAKAITAAGGFSMCVTTAVVAQNTRGVRTIHTPPLEVLRAQLEAVSDDVVLDAVKTGMLADAATVAEVARWVDEVRPPVLVVDPVMVSTSGHRLLEPEAEQAVRDFCRRATVVTPNTPELAVLLEEEPAEDEATALDQARRLAQRIGAAVVLKTGHLDGPRATNFWVAPDADPIAVPTRRLETTSTHGTGCSLAAALATRLGAGHAPADALTWTTDWLHESIAHGEALEVGGRRRHPVARSGRAARRHPVARSGRAARRHPVARSGRAARRRPHRASRFLPGRAPGRPRRGGVT